MRTFLREITENKALQIQAIGLSLYEPLPGTSQEQIGKEVVRTQWISPNPGKLLLGKRILIVDEVDDTRKTLGYALTELQKDIEEELLRFPETEREALRSATNRVAKGNTVKSKYLINCADNEKFFADITPEKKYRMFGWTTLGKPFAKMDAQRNNPYDQVCPDFATEAYAEARAAFREANAGVDDAVATVMLTQVWTLTNRAERTLWDAQAREREEREIERARGEELVREREAETRAQEERAAFSEEMKKNKFKYIDIPIRPPPTTPVEIPSRFATAKLQKGQYVELWYFTNAGLRHARTNEATVDEDAIMAVAGRDGRVDLVPATATKEAKAVVPDRQLTWDDFTIAVRCILFTMEAAAWTEQRIAMLANFWGRLQSHPFRSSPDPLDTDALLLYQDEQRRAWHQAITSPAGAWDISVVDEMLLARARDEVYREDRRKKDRERDSLVSGISLLAGRNTY
ncbi:hypothetical protein C0992_003442 [Termitomyces sp. T32_za158]|nr:hypothetical protein C0992_003442 [Termitomyces sp. T32_za158]